MTIRNLLFDLGGVILDIDRQHCVRAFEKLGADLSGLLGDYTQQGIFRALEEGRATAEEFYAAIRSRCPAGVTDAQILEAFDDFLLGIPAVRLDALRGYTRRGYNVCLLSNTNPLMWDGKIARAFRVCGLRREDYFPGGMVTSFEAHSCKPDRAIFDYAVAHLGIRPEETLFVDDSLANVEAARALGFHAVHVPTDGGEATELVDQYLTLHAPQQQ